MIKNKESLSMVESGKYLSSDVESEAEVAKFMKKFVKMSPKKAEEMRIEIESLGLIKVRPEHIAKIIDLLPDNPESLNKIFNDTSLDENETSKILQTAKKFE